MLYEEIGKKVYESHLREDGDFAKEDIKREDSEGLCVKIDVLSDEIEDLLRAMFGFKRQKTMQELLMLKWIKNINIVLIVEQSKTEKREKEEYEEYEFI